MNYIGNYKDWVTPELMKHLTSHAGDLRNVWQPERWQGHPELDKFRELARPGYSQGQSIFHQFNQGSPDMQNFSIVLPDLPETRKHCHWWFVKLNPGEMQAMHIDPHLVEVKNPVRYTMYLQDYIPGHIFLYKDFLSSNYKMGDVYEWSDPMLVHGCANVSFEPRYTLQITMYD
jgi:hypothetical protein